MKKMLSVICVLSLIMSMQIFAQGWSYTGAFPDTSFKGGGLGGHGIAVDPDGKVWIQLYGTTDSLDTGGGVFAKTRQIFVFNADGTPASFSGFNTITVDGVTDTLFNSSRGMKSDQDGNILFSSFNILYRANYKTGEGMNKLISPATGSGATLTAPAVDAAGDIFTRSVFPDYPIYMWGSDFSSSGTAVDTAGGFSRTLEVSADGNTIYNAGYTLNGVVVYNRASEFDPYTPVDTVMRGLAVESMAWNPKTGYLWVSSGNLGGGAPPNGDTTVMTSYTYPTWYAWDVNTWTIKDSINWHLTAPDEDARPRGIAFSTGGDTAYVLCFGNDTYSPVQMFVNTGATGVEKDDNTIVKGFNLSQNYPNPFNPTTEIKFSVAKPGLVTLKVYDILGREVATLVNENLVNGNYTATFNASKLASGTYVYQLNVGGVRISKKMMLLK
jgi:Secretion system C-terminal sorting domain